MNHPVNIAHALWAVSRALAPWDAAHILLGLRLAISLDSGITSIYLLPSNSATALLILP